MNTSGKKRKNKREGMKEENIRHKDIWELIIRFGEEVERQAQKNVELEPSHYINVRTGHFLSGLADKTPRHRAKCFSNL